MHFALSVNTDISVDFTNSLFLFTYSSCEFICRKNVDMSRLADKLRWELLFANVSGTFPAGYMMSPVRTLSGSVKNSRRRGRREEKPSGRQRSESNEEVVHSQLFEILSNSSKRRIPKHHESTLAQTTSLFIDTSKIPFLKYTMPEKDFERFRRNKSTTDERKRVLKIYETVLPRRKSQIPVIADSHRRIDTYSLRHHLFTTKGKTPEDILDEVKERVCSYYLIEESEYEKHKQEALQCKAPQNEEEVLDEEWKESYERMIGDPILSGAALSLKQNPSMSDSARADIAKVFLTHSK